MAKHFDGELKQGVCALTHSVPPVHAGPKFTVTLVPLPLTVASPEIDQKYEVAPSTAAVEYVPELFAHVVVAPLTAVGVLTIPRTHCVFLNELPQPLPACTPILYPEPLGVPNRTVTDGVVEIYGDALPLNVVPAGPSHVY